jgi:hypothetical protein
MRRLENYIRKYGPEFGPRLYHALQSQAAHAGVSARLRRKIDVLSGKAPAAPAKAQAGESLPLFPQTVFPEPEPADSTEAAAKPENAVVLAVSA